MLHLSTKYCLLVGLLSGLAQGLPLPGESLSLSHDSTPLLHPSLASQPPVAVQQHSSSQSHHKVRDDGQDGTLPLSALSTTTNNLPPLPFSPVDHYHHPTTDPSSPFVDDSSESHSTSSISSPSSLRGQDRMQPSTQSLPQSSIIPTHAASLQPIGLALNATKYAFGFVGGVLAQAGDTWDGGWSMIRHPIDSVGNVVSYIFLNPVQTGRAVMEDMKREAHEHPARFAGRTAFNVGVLALPWFWGARAAEAVNTAAAARRLSAPASAAGHATRYVTGSTRLAGWAEHGTEAAVHGANAIRQRFWKGGAVQPIIPSGPPTLMGRIGDAAKSTKNSFMRIPSKPRHSMALGAGAASLQWQNSVYNYNHGNFYLNRPGRPSSSSAPTDSTSHAETSGNKMKSASEPVAQSSSTLVIPPS